MVTAFDVEGTKLIKAVAEKLKADGMIKPPAWVAYVKTGAHKERATEESDFWYKRCASLLRKLYIGGPIGVSRLRKEYGSRKNRGAAAERHVKAGGSIIRKALQQLEKTGLVEKKGAGRVISKKGRALLDNTAKSLVA
ncbi:MAG: 30S ribosomal protein S19e [Candidatus Micrarchaeia archaeon]